MFSVGDEIKCVSLTSASHPGHSYRGITIGVVYIVTKSYSSNTFITIKNDNNHTLNYYSDHFVLFQSATTTHPANPPRQFQQYDLVECIDAKGLNGMLTTLKQYTVQSIQVSANGGKPTIRVLDDAGNSSEFLEGRFRYPYRAAPSTPPITPLPFKLDDWYTEKASRNVWHITSIDHLNKRLTLEKISHRRDVHNLPFSRLLDIFEPYKHLSDVQSETKNVINPEAKRCTCSGHVLLHKGCGCCAIKKHTTNWAGGNWNV